MLKKIVLTNFQAHPRLELELDKFTLLTGGSNSGKSAVLRAVGGLLRNDAVSDYVTHGQKQLSVELFFDDDYIVKWKKGSGVNDYSLTCPNGDVIAFTKVGSDVPSEIQEVLRLSPIALKGTDKLHINLHSQLESPFLISSTPGYVAKVLGELTAASQLYSAVSEGNSSLRSHNGLKKTRKADLDELFIKLSGFPDLDYAGELLDEAEELYKQSLQAHNDYHEAHDKKSLIGSCEFQAEATKSRIDGLLFVEDIDLLELELLSVDLNQCFEYETQIKNLNVSELTLTDEISKLEYTVNIDLGELELIGEKLSQLSSANVKFIELGTQTSSYESSILNTEGEILGLEQKEEELFSLLDTCPACGQELSSEAKVQLVGGKSHVNC